MASRAEGSMQKKLKIPVILSVWALIVIHSCTSPDATPPVVTIELPGDGMFIDAGDTILVRATAMDDEQIEKWTVTLTDEFFIPTGDRIEFQPSGKNVQIELEYPIPIDLASGLYYLRVSATDGESNTNAFSQLNATGIPRERLGIVAVVESGGQYTAKYREEGSGWQTLGSLGDEFSGADVSSATQRFIAGGVEMEPMRVFDLNTMLPVYERSCSSAPGDPCIATVATDGDHFYMGKHEGRITSWSASGQLQLDFPLPEFRFPRSIYFQDDHIFVEEWSTTNPNRHWSAYNANNGVPQQELLLEGSFVDAFPVSSNQTLIVTNHQGVGKIRYYFYDQNGYQLPIPGPSGPIDAIAQRSSTQYYYGQSDGIYSLDLSNTNNLLFKPGVQPSAMAYDDIRNELLCAVGTVIFGYDADSGAQLYVTAPGGNVVDLFLWYSR